MKLCLGEMQREKEGGSRFVRERMGREGGLRGNVEEDRVVRREDVGVVGVEFVVVVVQGRLLKLVALQDRVAVLAVRWNWALNTLVLKNSSADSSTKEIPSVSLFRVCHYDPTSVPQVFFVAARCVEETRLVEG